MAKNYKLVLSLSKESVANFSMNYELPTTNSPRNQRLKPCVIYPERIYTELVEVVEGICEIRDKGLRL